MSKFKRITIGLKDFDGMWYIKIVEMDKRYSAPNEVKFPNGCAGELIETTRNGRYLYERIV